MSHNVDGQSRPLASKDSYEQRRHSSLYSDLSFQEKSLQRPQKAHYKPTSPNPQHHRGHDSMISQPISPLTSYSSSSSSMSSANEEAYKISSSTSTQQGVLVGSGDRRYHPPIANNGDVERQVNGHKSPTRSTRRKSAEAGYGYEGDVNDVNLSDKALGLLVYLSFICPFVSIGAVLWTILSLVLATICLPLRLFTYHESTTLHTLLFPILRFQLGLIHSTAVRTTKGNTFFLLIINLASPVVSFGVALCSWVVAFFWFFSAILGDPAGKDGHNDGKASVLSVRAWWERYLLSGSR